MAAGMQQHTTRRSHGKLVQRMTRLVTLIFVCTVSIAALTAMNGIPSVHAEDAKPTDATASLRQAPNSRVQLALPAGFEPAKLYSGFENEARGISFVIFEAPATAYREMAQGFTPETLAKRGILAAERGTLAREGDYVYLRARQSSTAGTYAKFFVLFATPDQTVLVTANVPETVIETGGMTRHDIEAVLASARTAAVADIKEIYKLGYMGPFKEAGRVAGTAKLYTLDGKLQRDSKADARAALIVAPSIDKRPIGNLEDTAKTLLQSLAGYRDVAPKPPVPVEIAGMRGVEIEAEAVEQQSSAKMLIYQVLLMAKDGGYYRLVGLAPREDADRLLPEFQRIAKGLVVF